MNSDGNLIEKVSCPLIVNLAPQGNRVVQSDVFVKFEYDRVHMLQPTRIMCPYINNGECNLKKELGTDREELKNTTYDCYLSSWKPL